MIRLNIFLYSFFYISVTYIVKKILIGLIYLSFIYLNGAMCNATIQKYSQRHTALKTDRTYNNPYLIDHISKKCILIKNKGRCLQCNNNLN